MAGLKTIPSVVQLPGGIRLRGVAFEIVELDAEGRPLRFEVLPADRQHETGPRIWVLFCDEQALRQPMLDKGREVKP